MKTAITVKEFVLSTLGVLGSKKAVEILNRAVMTHFVFLGEKKVNMTRSNVRSDSDRIKVSSHAIILRYRG